MSVGVQAGVFLFLVGLTVAAVSLAVSVVCELGEPDSPGSRLGLRVAILSGIASALGLVVALVAGSS